MKKEIINLLKTKDGRTAFINIIKTLEAEQQQLKKQIKHMKIVTDE